MAVHDTSLSFADGRALCALVRHYFPEELPRESIDQTDVLLDASLGQGPSGATAKGKATWAEAFLGAGSVRDDGVEGRMRAVRHNFRVFWAAASRISGGRIPAVLSADDVLEYGPDPR